MTKKEEILQNMMMAMMLFRSAPDVKTFAGLTKGECAILTMLYKVNRDVSSGEFSSALKLGTGHVANSLKSLEAKKLIVRKEDHLDKRKTLVSLTEKGSALISERMERTQAEFYAFIDAYGEDKLLKFSEESLDIVRFLEKEKGNRNPQEVKEKDV